MDNVSDFLPQSSVSLRAKNFFGLFLITLVVTAVFTLSTSKTTQAAVSCTNNSWSVANETDLNDAITCYNAKTNTGDYTITFTQNISLTTNTTPINNTVSHVALIVEGGGLTIDAQEIKDARPFHINPDTSVSIQNITIINGYTSYEGSGIANYGILMVSNSILKDNWAGNGSIYNESILTINNSNIINNSGVFGGGITNTGILTINNSTIGENNGGLGGGGIFNTGDSSKTTISNSTINGNVGEDAGGILSLHGASLTIINSTISGNIGTFAGGISGGSPLIVKSSTFTDNDALVGGSDIGGGNLIISNSILASSNALGDCLNSLTIIDNGHNIVKDNNCGLSSSNSDPLLGPLQDNGGPTHTHALLPGSPAIDAGNTDLATDQRGFARPQGSADDIGAFEVLDCSPQLWPVASEENLNAAISCYNAKTSPGDYHITFNRDINLITDTVPISNTTSNVALIVEGAGFMVDGQDSARPLTINPNTAVTLQNITIRNGYTTLAGGGVLNDGNLSVNNSTLNDNYAGYYGGGIYNNGTVILSNCTLSHNSARLLGGGIGNGANGIVIMNDSTLSDNVGPVGGIWIFDGTVTIRNSIIANSIGGNDCVNYVGTVIDGGYNIVEDNGCGFSGGTDPLLGPLQNNGGPTHTHALLPGSPAIDSGDTNLTTDQRGVSRPYGPADDIGAFEFIPPFYLPLIRK